ncbi:unnamed protein product [Closterium sp. Yama58-4]|nr:unnamed protein product [Closterium sp. Yama58-4]
MWLVRRRHLPDSLRAVRDHFLALDPTDLTVDLLEEHLLAAETSIVAVGAARDTPRMPLFEGCSPSPLAPSNASAAAVDFLGAEEVGAASAPSGKLRNGKGKGGKSGGVVAGVGASVAAVAAAVGVVVAVVAAVGVVAAVVVVAVGVVAAAVVVVGVEPFRGEVLAVASGSSNSVRARPLHPSSFVSGLLHVGRLGVVFAARTSSAQVTALVRHAGSITHTQHRCFSRLDDACAEGDCYLCVPPDPGIEAAALGASESALSGTALAEALHTFTLDSVPFGSLSGLHLPSFSTNLVSIAALEDEMVTITTPWGQRVAICTCARTGRHLATFTRRPGSSLYTQTTEPAQVAASGQVSASGQVAAPCSCRLLSHQTLLWHHRLGHPSLPRLHGMHSRLLVSGLPRSLPLLLPLPAPPCLPCVEGRQRAAPHSSSFPPRIALLQTLHMDVWDPAHIRRQDRVRYFLLVVDDYTRYTTVFPLHSKGEVPDVLIPWIRAVRLQLRERFREDLPVLRLHSDRGGEFSSDLLRDFCRGEGILQSFTLPASPQQNGVAERRIGLVMEVARASMIHAAAPHFLWPFAVRYAAHQLNLWPRVSMSETSPTCVGRGRLAMRWCRGFGALVPLSVIPPRTSSPPAPFPVSSLASPDVTFDESVPFYCLFPYRTAPLPPPPAALPRSRSPSVRPPSPPKGPAPSGLSQVDPLPLAELVEVTSDSGAARGAASGGVEPAGSEPGGAEPERAEPGGAEPGGAEPGGSEPGGVEPGGEGARGVEAGGSESGGAEPAGAEPRGATLALEALRLEPLELEALELEALELEALALDALKLEALELEALELEALELDALALEALELEAQEPGALELGALSLETLELEALEL